MCIWRLTDREQMLHFPLINYLWIYKEDMQNAHMHNKAYKFIGSIHLKLKNNSFLKNGVWLISLHVGRTIAQW